MKFESASYHPIEFYVMFYLFKQVAILDSFINTTAVLLLYVDENIKPRFLLA